MFVDCVVVVACVLCELLVCFVPGGGLFVCVFVFVLLCVPLFVLLVDCVVYLSVLEVCLFCVFRFECLFGG